MISIRLILGLTQIYPAVVLKGYAQDEGQEKDKDTEGGGVLHADNTVKAFRWS